MGLMSSLNAFGARLLGRGGDFAPVGADALAGMFGQPHRPAPTRDKIAADVWVQPYRSPIDLDPYGGETAQMRRSYRDRYRDTPVLRAAVRGKADALSCLDVIVLPGDKNSPKALLAADFLDWAVQRSPRGWRGVIDSIYTAASLDGYSLCEKKLEPGEWRGRYCWALAHLRQLDTAYLRLQLDQYRNVLSVVNMIRGLEYYSPDDVVIHTHNGMYGSPFGQSDARAATRACNIIEDVYKVWYIALKVYGLPYMYGKVKDPTKQKAMRAALKSLRDGGFSVTGPDDDIEILNMAAAAATDGFERMVQTQREDVFFSVRGASLPFLEGDGGQNAHGDAGVQKAASDANEYASALDVADTINRQLIPWLIGPNFGADCPMPRVKLGGTNWGETQKLLGIIGEAQRAGLSVSAEWAYDVTGIEPPRDDSDKLVSTEEKQAQQQQQQPGTPAPAPGGEPAPPDDQADPTGVQDEATAAALDALGVPADGGTEPQTFAEGHHREGEKWKTRDGRWMTIKGGRAVPTKDPGASSEPLADRKPTKPGGDGPRSSTGTPPGAHPGGLVSMRQVMQDPKFGGDNGRASEAVYSRVASHLAAGGKVTAWMDGKPIPITSVSGGIMRDAKGAPWGANGLAFGTGKSGVEFHPVTSAAPPAAPKKPTPEDDEASRVAWDKVPEPKKAAAAKRVAFKANTPAGKAMLAKVEQWADAQAAKHAERYAAHLGIPVERAQAILAFTIKMLSRVALEGGKDQSETIEGQGGRRAKVNVKLKRFSADAAPVRVATALLVADPARFQFRRGHDAGDGTVRDMPAERFDPKRCPPLLCWRDPADGQVYVIDGHHRLAWAERDGVTRLPVTFIEADDADEAREIGRRANVGAAPATFSAHVDPAIDAVQIMRVLDSLLSEVLV